MEGPTAVFLAMIIIGLPVLMLMLIANRYFRLREKKLEVEATLAAEKAAQYASRSVELEQRVRILEQIVTDSGAQTASQIEALRQPARIPAGKRLHESLRVRPRDHRRHRHIFAPAPPDGRPAALGSAGRATGGKVPRMRCSGSRSTSSRIAFACSSASSPIAAPRLQRRSKRFVTTKRITEKE